MLTEILGHELMEGMRIIQTNIPNHSSPNTRDWLLYRFIEVNFSKLTDSNQIFRN